MQQAEDTDEGLPRTDARRRLAWFQLGAVVFIMLVASALHFAYELSGFWGPMALFGSVNESTYEHLKLFFWPGLLYALVQHAYVKEFTNNYWVAKAAALLVSPIVLIVSFYCYLGIVLPINGRGTLFASIATGLLGVVVGEFVAYRIMLSRPLASGIRRLGAPTLVALTIMFSTLTFFPPRMFLFENFFGYEYSGEYGILDDYTPYLVFESTP
jgi:hypothetical protein